MQSKPTDPFGSLNRRPRRWTVGAIAGSAAAAILGLSITAVPVSASPIIVHWDSLIQDSNRGDYLEGTNYPSIPVGTFHDDAACTVACAPGSAYPGTVTVFWGDSSSTSPSPGTATLVSQAGSVGTYSVTGAHTFPDEFFSATGQPPLGFPIHIHVTPDSQPNTVYISPTYPELNAGFIAATDAPRQAGNANFSFSPVASVPFTGQIGSFLDGNQSATVTDQGGSANEYAISIDWGDGTTADTTSGTVSIGTCDGTHGPAGGPGCEVDVSGTHTYQVGGNYNVSITVADGANHLQLTATTTGSVTQFVTTSAISDSNAADHVEGVRYTSIPIATFTDSDACQPGCQPASDYSADINWGDGTTTSATSISLETFTGNTGTYDVAADHMYAEAGTYPISVNVTDTGETPNINNAGTGSIVVGEAPLHSTALTIRPTAQAVFNGEIGTFQDESQLLTAQDNGSPEYTVHINWGDGSPIDTSTGSYLIGSCGSSAGSAPGQGCIVVINGSHRYSTAGNFTVTVTVGDGTNSSALVFTTSAHVLPPRLALHQAGAGSPGGRPTNQSLAGTAGTRVMSVQGSIRAAARTVASAPVLTTRLSARDRFVAVKETQLFSGWNN